MSITRPALPSLAVSKDPVADSVGLGKARNKYFLNEHPQGILMIRQVWETYLSSSVQVAITKYPRQDGLETGELYFSGMEARSLRSGCLRAQVRALLGIEDFLYVHGGSVSLL